jgi:hypothetical protein
VARDELEDVATASEVLGARFREEVVLRGTFSGLPLAKITSWESLLRELEGAQARVPQDRLYEGFTACYLLWRLPDAHVTCVDTFAGSAEHARLGMDLSRLERTFDANVALVDGSRVRKLVGDSRQVLLALLEEGVRFDLVYVDGSHLALDVLVDAALAWQLLRQDGLMIFDDYTWRVLGDHPLLRPGRAIDAFLDIVQEEGMPLFRGKQILVRKSRDTPTPG